MALKLESTLLCCWTMASYKASRVVSADSTVPGSSVAPSSALLLVAALLPGTVARGCPRSPQSDSALCTVEPKHLGRRQQHRGSRSVWHSRHRALARLLSCSERTAASSCSGALSSRHMLLAFCVRRATRSCKTAADGQPTERETVKACISSCTGRLFDFSSCAKRENTALLCMAQPDVLGP